MNDLSSPGPGQPPLLPWLRDGPVHTSDQAHVSDDNKDTDTKQRASHDGTSNHPLKGRRSSKRVAMFLTKPSYTLRVGSMNVCRDNRIRLRCLLRKLVVQHNWVDASGVLSTLLKGTCREKSPHNNRMKYWAAMELLQHMKIDPNAYSSRIQHLYDTWKEKIKSKRKWPLKDRSVMLEYILSCLARNSHDYARINLQSLQQEDEHARDEKSDLIMGLTNYELWYSDLPNEMRLGNLEETCLHLESDIVKNNSSEDTYNLKEEDAASIYETFSNLHYHSETSVMNDKYTDANVNQRLDVEVYRAKPIEQNKKFQSQDFYMNSAESSGETDGSMQDDYDQFHCSSPYNIHSLQSLLPVRVPSSENLMDIISFRRLFFGDHYKEALKFLKLALQSPRPISEAALLPLIQLLLLGGHANEAIVVLEQFCNESSSVLSLRLRSCPLNDISSIEMHSDK